MHPYFDAYKDDESIIEAPEQFDWAWDNFEPTKDILQNMVFEESLQFHTEDEDWSNDGSIVKQAWMTANFQYSSTWHCAVLNQIAS